MDTCSKGQKVNYWDTLPQDSADILHKLDKLRPNDSEAPVEILAELPAAVNIDIIIAMVSRWHEIQLFMKKPLRVFAWSSEGAVEKYVAGLVGPIDNLYLTVLPITLKERKKNVK